MSAFTYKVRKLQDPELVSKLREIQKQSGHAFAHLSFEVPTISHSSGPLKEKEWDHDPTLRQIVELHTALVSTVLLTFESNFTVKYTRTADIFTDNVTIVASSGGPEKTKALKFVEAVRSVFDEHTPIIESKEFASTQLGQVYQARENHLSQQENRLFGFFDATRKFIEDRELDYEVRRKALDDINAERERRQEEEQAKFRENLANERASFHKEIEDFDVARARANRRQLRDKLKDELEDLLDEFQTTPETRRLRWPTLITMVVAMGLLAMAFAYCISRFPLATDAGAINIPNLIRQAALGLSLFASVTFFVRWCNHWSQRHAEEEFRLKKNSLDVDWANWLVEVAIEWQQEYKKEIPTDLLNHLSRNLFTNDTIDYHDIHPAETIASALFGAASKFKWSRDGVDLEVDRRGIDKLKKPIPPT